MQFNLQMLEERVPKDAKELPEITALLERIIEALNRRAIDTQDGLNGQLTFGDGTLTDNLAGVWVTYTTHATPGSESTVVHNLGIIPAGFILMVPPTAGVINNGATPWNTLNLYLTATSANKPVTIFVLRSPLTN